MFSLLKVNLKVFDFSSSVTGIGRVGDSTADPSPAATKELHIGWQKAVTDDSIFSLLSWHTRLSEFKGRDKEMKELKAWAEDDKPIWAKFVVALGGVGKSRLGAEFAEMMQAEGWAAGFLDLRKPQDFQMNKKGTLLVIDYPKAQIKNVTELLTDLVNLNSTNKIRVLFLTRQSVASWDHVLGASKSRNIVDVNKPIHLQPMNAESATTIYNSTVARVLEALNRKSSGEEGEALIEETAMAEWIGSERAPENKLALFIMAAAIHSAEQPSREIVKYTGRQIIDALVKRELDRWEATASAKGFESRYALARLWSMAAIADSISVDRIKELIDTGLPIGIKSSVELFEQLETTGVLVNRHVPAPKPDIVAAAFLAEVFGKDPATAPELLWAALEPDVEGGLDRIGRLTYDAEVVLGMRDLRISSCLAKAAEGQIERCKELSIPLSEEYLAYGLRTVEVVVWRLLADDADDESDKAGYLNNLSVHLSDLGDKQQALEAINKAVEIRRRLATDNPATFEPDLAMSLNNLSNHLSDLGDMQKALDAITDAVVIYRRLATDNPAAFEPDLATSLNNLSIRLSDLGHKPKALEAINESVEIYRRLAADNPAAHQPDLAMSLNNLSNRLSGLGDKQKALDAITDAVVIYRRLATDNPAAFEPDLAGSLNNLSNRLGDLGDKPKALEAINEAVEIHRRLATDNPAAFEPVLAGNLNNLSICLSDIGDKPKALEAINEAIEIRRRLAADNPAAFEPVLAMSLNNLSNRLSDIGDKPKALEAIVEAVEIRRRLAADNPAAYEPDLAMSLNNLSNRLGDIGDNQKALEAINEAIEIYRRLATDNPAAHQPDLAMSLNNRSNHLSDLGDKPKALEAINESVEIHRRLAADNPAAHQPDLAMSLSVLGDRLVGVGEVTQAIQVYKEAIELIRPYAVKLPASRHADLLKWTEGDLAKAQEMLGK